MLNWTSLWSNAAGLFLHPCFSGCTCPSAIMPENQGVSTFPIILCFSWQYSLVWQWTVAEFLSFLIILTMELLSHSSAAHSCYLEFLPIITRREFTLLFNNCCSSWQSSWSFATLCACSSSVFLSAVMAASISRLLVSFAKTPRSTFCFYIYGKLSAICCAAWFIWHSRPSANIGRPPCICSFLSCIWNLGFATGWKEHIQNQPKMVNSNGGEIRFTLHFLKPFADWNTVIFQNPHFYDCFNAVLQSNVDKNACKVSIKCIY